MAIIAMPTHVWWDSVSSLRLQRSGLNMRSRYTGRRQSVTFPFAMWTFEGTTVKLDGTDAADWRAFLLQLVGMTNSFRMPVPGTDGGPLSGFAGTAVAGTGGAAIAAKSMPVTTTGAGVTFLKRGDYFTINDELKIATADCPTGTNQPLSFEPFLRSAVTAGTGINFLAPTILMVAADFDQADWSLEAPVEHTIKLKAVEDISASAGGGSALLAEDGSDILTEP